MSSKDHMHYLITGAAGFIGFHLAQRLLGQGHTVTGIDNLNDYYDPALKQDRLEILQEQDHFSFHRIDIANKDGIDYLFDNVAFDRVAEWCIGLDVVPVAAADPLMGEVAGLLELGHPVPQSVELSRRALHVRSAPAESARAAA